MAFGIKEEVKVLKLAAGFRELVGNSGGNVASGIANIDMDGIQLSMVGGRVFCEIKREHEVWYLGADRSGKTQQAFGDCGQSFDGNDSILSCVVVNVDFECPVSVDLLDAVDTAKITNSAADGL